MQCHEFDERLHALLDERQVPARDPQLQAHAQQCSNCGQILRAQELLFLQFDPSGSPPLPGGFAARVVSQMERPVTSRLFVAATRPWLLAGTVVATAAAALIALAVVLNWEPDRLTAPDVAAPAEPAAENTNNFSLVVDDSSTKSHGQSRTQLAATAGQPTPTLRAANVESLEQYGQALQSLASQVPQAVERLDEVEEATPGLRPVRTSFTLAIGTIRRTIPPPRKQAEPPKPRKRDSGWLWSAADQATV